MDEKQRRVELARAKLAGGSQSLHEAVTRWLAATEMVRQADEEIRTWQNVVLQQRADLFAAEKEAER